MKVPELLVRTRRFNQMEIQMDKFLAKKNPIFKQVAEGASVQGGEKADVAFVNFGLSHSDLAVRYRINGTIL